jgi:alkylhydroperoxidase/carboxymuconolactone decarboxylase family protein YurZ
MTRSPSPAEVAAEQIRLLRGLALGNARAVEQVVADDLTDAATLDARTAALVRIVAIMAGTSDIAANQWAVDAAIAAGVPDEDVLTAILHVAPIIGSARLNAVLPQLMEAFGLDLLDT